MDNWEFTPRINIENIYSSHSYLKENINKSFSILDLGFNEPSDFIYLNYKLPITKYIGVDINNSSTFRINKPVPEGVEIPEEFSSRESPYCEYLKFHKYYGTGNPLNEPEFTNTFKFIFNTDALCYFSKLCEHEKFNLIVISNLLHLIDRTSGKKLFKKSFEHLLEQGLMYIQVYQQDNSLTLDNNIKPYSHTEINDLKIMFSVIHVDTLDGTGKRTIVGQK